MPLLRSKLEYLVLHKALRKRRFEINDILRLLFELNFSPFSTTKYRKYENVDINILCIRLCHMLTSITVTEVDNSSQERRENINRLKFGRLKRAQEPTIFVYARTSARELDICELNLMAQSNGFVFSVLKKPSRHGKDCPYYDRKKQRALFAGAVAKTDYVESNTMMVIHSLIIPLLPRDNACIGSYWNIANTSAQGDIQNRATV